MAIALIRLSGDKVDSMSFIHCITCDECRKPKIHTKFYIENKQIFATNKCEHCNTEDKKSHRIWFFK